jgi:hypothetical protein
MLEQIERFLIIKPLAVEIEADRMRPSASSNAYSLVRFQQLILTRRQIGGQLPHSIELTGIDVQQFNAKVQVAAPRVQLEVGLGPFSRP